MGCYGIGVSRTLAMVYENSIIKRNDKFEGISLPLNITPYSLYIIPKIDDKEKMELSEKIYNLLGSREVPTLFDDREVVSIGAKIKDSKVLGIPYTVVFGKTLEEGFVSVENNKTGEKINMTVEEFITNFIEFESYRKYNITLEEYLKKKNNIKEDFSKNNIKKIHR